MQVFETSHSKIAFQDETKIQDASYIFMLGISTSFNQSI